MNFDFLFILTTLTLISGGISLVDLIFWKKKRAAAQDPKLVEYSHAFFPVFLLVLLIRSFIAEPFRVPTGSLEPTVMPGALLLVTQYNYGLRLPVWGTKIIPTGELKRGQIVVFHWPVDHSVDFVKRVIGLPGDHISYINKVLYVNGQVMPQQFVGYATDSDGTNSRRWPVKIMQENLDGVSHQIYVCANQNQCPVPAQNFDNLVVPAGEYFMMGDNRDNSDDSRSWGFVKDDLIVGRAVFIWFSWDSATSRVRWDQLGSIK